MARVGRKFRRGGGESVRVELPALPELGFAEPEWVELKKTLGRDDERRRSRLSLTGMEIEDGKVKGDVADMVLAAELAHLTVAIAAWSFDEKIEMPVIALMEEPWLDLLKAKCDELHPAPLSETDVKNSESGSSTPS